MNIGLINAISSLITIFSTIVIAVATLLGMWLSVNDHRVKLQAETRLTDSTKAETDIRLLQHFTEILYIASGRKGDGIFSKEIFDELIKRKILTDEVFKDADKLNETISRAAIIAQIPGDASADAAFASIVVLAKRHCVLYEPAIAALESFRGWEKKRVLSEKCLSLIREDPKAGDCTAGGKLS